MQRYSLGCGTENMFSYDNFVSLFCDGMLGECDDESAVCMDRKILFACVCAALLFYGRNKGNITIFA